MAESPEGRLTQAQDEQLPDVVERVTPRVARLLRDPTQTSAVVRIVAQEVIEHYQGPLPHPEHLRRFEEISPGAAAHLIGMAEREQSHRHSMERSEINYPYYGLGSGLLIAVVAVGGAIYLGSVGNIAVAVALVGVPVIGCIGWFVKSRVSLSKPQSPAPPSPTQPQRRKRR
jgi:uncharacterized membrane protein